MRLRLALKRLASAFWDESRISAKNRRSLHISRSHCATVFGSNRTQVPMRNDGILPAFACLKIVTLATVNILASSSAVKARPIRSIRSANDKGSAVLFWEHDCIYLLCGFTSAATAAYCCRTVVRARLENLQCSRLRLTVERAHGCTTYLLFGFTAKLLLFPVCQSRNPFPPGDRIVDF
jgi:hypothetical protein